MDRLAASLEIKAVDDGQRLIEGYAAAWSLDRVGDVIDVKAFDRTLREKPPADVAVFVGHQHDALPVGEALELRPDGHGLHTKTRVLEGPQGDQLLAAARRGLLGLSIGYRVRSSKPDRLDGKTVRRLTDVDLVEYSFAAKATIANPAALITSVKQEGSMPWRVDKRDGRFCVVKESDGSQVACHDTEAGAMAQMRALYASEGKSVLEDTLPDSAFAYVEPGALDTERKTIPRENRHFPHHLPDGTVDPEAVRRCVAEAASSPLAQKALPHLLRHAAGHDDAADPVWVDSAPAALLVAAHELTGIAETMAAQLTHMAGLGRETKSGWMTTPTARAELRSLATRITSLIERAEGADTGADAGALADWWRMQLSLLEV